MKRKVTSPHHEAAATQARAARRRAGFTIVELLIVILVIAILAAITIVAYNGITRRAIETSMQSDLRNAATSLELDNSRDGSYPLSAATANGGRGLQTSGGNVLTYGTRPYGYCVTMTNTKTPTTYALKSTTGQILEGNCDIAVSTVAGSTQGSADGTGAAAQFNNPLGVAIDGAGNLYVADYNNHRIRKVTPTGTVTTLAGSTPGLTDGTGSAAQFLYPAGITIDAKGDLYVADRYNHRIRKVTSGGVVSTVAGSGVGGGYVDGPSGSARFNNPMDVTVDSQGNLFVVERDGHRVRKITPGGDVSTLAGSTQGFNDGTGAAAQFNSPVGITIDAAGNLYVADESNQRIRKVTQTGIVTTVAGTGVIGGTDGPGNTAQFSYPRDIAVDSTGNLYIADNAADRIRMISPSRMVSTYAGRSEAYGTADGTDFTGRFGHPSGIAFDSRWNLYVTDFDTHRIRKVTQ